ncbi:MAG: putative glycoside hydrolase [Parcubacteria group bacterium]
MPPWFHRSLILVVAVGSTLFLIDFFTPSFSTSTHSASLPRASLGEFSTTLTESQAVLVTHLETPEPLKALYMTACVAGTSFWRESLKRFIETTELNAVVIDIKDYTGVVSFPNDFPKVFIELGFVAQPGCVVSDMREFIQTLHEAGIYVIGRLSVFQDPSYTKLFPALAVKKKSDGEVWTDYKGLSFIDVGARPYWDYIVALSEEAYALGFDEINYDYVRYPSDGNVQDTLYTWTPKQSSNEDATGQASTTPTSDRLMTKAEVLKDFFEYLHDSLKDTGVKLSVDLFGMTTTAENDMNIGQVLENALPYFDYVSPMVYPSHYPPTWGGFSNPAEHPYEVVRIAMSRGMERERILNISNGLATSTPSKFRPWLQDFNLGAVYGPDKVRAQIQATYDAGLTSWMLWNAGNKYTTSALLLE